MRYKWRNVIIILTVELIKKDSSIKMSYLPPYISIVKSKIEVELGLSNYATKFDLKNAAGVYT